MPLSCQVAPLSQRELHKDGGGGGGGDEARKARWYAFRNSLHNALRRVLDVLVLHESPKEGVGGGGRWRVPR